MPDGAWGSPGSPTLCCGTAKGAAVRIEHQAEKHLLSPLSQGSQDMSRVLRAGYPLQVESDYAVGVCPKLFRPARAFLAAGCKELELYRFLLPAR